MSTPVYRSLSITAAGFVAKDWDGTDTNGDGVLDPKTDAIKNYEINAEGITYYNPDGTPNVSVTIEGTCFH